MTSDSALAQDAAALRGAVVTPTAVIEDGAVVVRGEWIVWVGSVQDAAEEGWGEVVGAAEPDPGLMILPGLVDIHNHGGGGASFPDAETPDQALAAVREHRAHGTTSLIASLVTADRETLLRRTATLADLADAGEIAGIHLEGPFLSVARRGAQNPEDMLSGDPELVRAIAAAARGHLRTMTVASEVPGVADEGGVIDTLIEVGAIPSIGHTDASTEQTERAIAAARRALRSAGRPDAPITATHLFNGMRPLHHRDPGPIPACLAAAARGEMVVELIADGVHLDPALVHDLADMLGAAPECGLQAAQGPGRYAFVTDAMAAAGMADGSYQLGPKAVTVAGGVARLTGGESIAGGTSHLLDQVRVATAAGVDLVDAVRAASTTPARVVGLDEVGALAIGRRADILMVDRGMSPLRVLRSGRDADRAAPRH